MTVGLLDCVFEVSRVVRETGVTFDEAKEIVYAALEPKPEPESNIVRMSDYVRRMEEKTIGAL